MQLTSVGRNLETIEHLDELLGLLNRTVHLPVTTNEKVANHVEYIKLFLREKKSKEEKVRCAATSRLIYTMQDKSHFSPGFYSRSMV